VDAVTKLLVAIVFCNLAKVKALHAMLIKDDAVRTLIPLTLESKADTRRWDPPHPLHPCLCVYTCTCTCTCHSIYTCTCTCTCTSDCAYYRHLAAAPARRGQLTFTPPPPPLPPSAHP
jgi:hypothetical protein